MIMIKFFFQLYYREIDFFAFDSIVDENIFNDFVVYNNVNIIFRNVKLFVQQIQRVKIKRR